MPKPTASSSEKLHTIQDVAALWAVDCKTVSRWLTIHRVPIVAPTQRTVRIPESSLARLLAIRLKCPACKQPVALKGLGKN